MPPRKNVPRSVPHAKETPELWSPELEAEPATVASIAERQAAQEPLTPAKREAQRRHEQELLAAAASATVAGTVRELAELKLKLGDTLDELSAGLAQQARRLATFDEAIAFQEKRLNELHEVEIVADSLERMLASHAERRRTVEEEAEQQAEVLDRTRREAREGWEREQQAFREGLAAEKERAKKEWVREQEEHQYQLKTSRARDDADYVAQRQAAVQKLAEERAKQEKELSAREAALAQREAEVAALRTRVEGFQAELQRAIDEARVGAIKEAEGRAAHEGELRSREARGTEQLLEQRIAQLQNLAKEQSTRIEQLQAELQDANAKVRDIALKAIEGAAGVSALARVNEIALQQAKSKGRGEA